MKPPLHNEISRTHIHRAQTKGSVHKRDNRTKIKPDADMPDGTQDATHAAVGEVHQRDKVEDTKVETRAAVGEAPCLTSKVILWT